MLFQHQIDLNNEKCGRCYVCICMIMVSTCIIRVNTYSSTGSNAVPGCRREGYPVGSWNGAPTELSTVGRNAAVPQMLAIAKLSREPATRRSCALSAIAAAMPARLAHRICEEYRDGLGGMRTVNVHYEGRLVSSHLHSYS